MMATRVFLTTLLFGIACPSFSAEPTRDEVVAAMRPYDGPTAKGVDRTTLTGKVMAGYQGWFNTPGDGSGQGWRHYTNHGEFRPGCCKIDQWPDVSELDEDERYPTPFHHADGRAACVFSSYNRKTVLRHFRWMQEYGIDGVFVQRFAVSTVRPGDLRHCNTVLAHCREGANQFGRCYAIMYDLSGLRAGGTRQVVEDWKFLVDRMRVGRDEHDHAYLKHNGKPVVAVWGFGFNDGRQYTLAECDRLVAFLKDDPKYGGNTVLLGVPTGWRTVNRDAIPDPALHATLLKADIISPWTVGRYQSPEKVERHAVACWKPDIAWCREHGKEYLPVVFPGFSWKNMYPESKAKPIPRLKGEFLWRQYVEAKRAGATMIYQAMFDEMDEGTAIFKCTNDPPVGESQFVTYEGLPTDHYLWLTGMGGRLLRGAVESSSKVPNRSLEESGSAAEHALASLERSYWLHASLAPVPQKGYWGWGFPACSHPTDQEIQNAVKLLCDNYAANRLYLVYHHEIPLDEAERVFMSWRKHCPVQIVPTLLLRMYDKTQSEVFTPEELRRLVEFFQWRINPDQLAVYDVHGHRDQGESLRYLAGQYPKGLIRIGIQPDEKIQLPFVAAVQDTWSGFCQGKTNADWQDRGFGAETLRRWVQQRNQEQARVVWDLITVAWDYSTTQRGGYPGYDDAAKNMPLPAGRNRLAAEEIFRTAQGLGGFSSDLLILQANSRAHDSPANFYETLKRGQVYRGYYSGPFSEIIGIFNRLKERKSPLNR